VRAANRATDEVRKRESESEREREREITRILLFLFPVYGPPGAVDDDRGIPMPLPCATCVVRLNRAGGAGPSMFGGKRALRQDGRHEPPVKWLDPGADSWGSP
jgi:hypothetical protein